MLLWVQGLVLWALRSQQASMPQKACGLSDSAHLPKWQEKVSQRQEASQIPKASAPGATEQREQEQEQRWALSPA